MVLTGQQFEALMPDATQLYSDEPENDRGWRWSQELGLYLGIENEKLRYFTPEGTLYQIRLFTRQTL